MKKIDVIESWAVVGDWEGVTGEDLDVYDGAGVVESGRYLAAMSQVVIHGRRRFADGRDFFWVRTVGSNKFCWVPGFCQFWSWKQLSVSLAARPRISEQVGQHPVLTLDVRLLLAPFFVALADVLTDARESSARIVA